MDKEDEYFSSGSSDEEEEVKLIEGEEIPIPQYTKEELAKLLLYIQQISTCYELSEDEISESFAEHSFKWLHNIMEPFLFVYFDQGVLSAGLGCPLNPVTQMTYFIREEPGHMFTVDGFYDEISFGTFDENVDETLLHLMNKLFAPVILKDKRWSEEVKAKFFTELHSLMSNLTDVNSQIGDTIILYIPNEGHDLEFLKAKEDKGLVKRYESVLIYWTYQIRGCLNKMNAFHQNEIETPSDEHDFWIHKFEIVTGILSQIESKEVDHMLKLLRHAELLSVKAFDELIEELTQEVKYSGENTKFLKLILEPFEDLRKSEYPTDIPAKLHKTIYLIRVISLNCDYYNSKEKTERLFIFVTNAIVTFCTSQILIERILNGEPRFGIKICDMSIDCCIMYKQIYQKLLKHLQEEDFKETWQGLDERKIFSKIDTFVGRLNDLILICEGIIVFSRKDETVKVPPLIFGGHKGSEITIECFKMEQIFAKGLDKIKLASEMILDVDSNEWFPEMAQFNDLLMSLDGIAKNLIAQVFSNLDNVEEALDSLTTFYNFSKRKTLQSLYDEKVEIMWKMFEIEVLETSKSVTGSKGYLGCLPLYSGRAAALHIKMRKCQRLHDLLSSAHYLPKLASTEAKLKTYEVTMESIKKKIEEYNNEWSSAINKTPEIYLDNFLIARSSSKNGLLECNIHRDILKIFDEAKHFGFLEKPLPDFLSAINEKSQATVSVCNKVIYVVLLYNKILESLSKEERLLFRQHSKTMDKKVQPGIVRLKYGDEMTDEYITDCLKNIAEIQHFVDIYKIINSVYMKLFEKIANGLILNLNIESTLTLTEFKKQFKDSRNDSSLEIGGHYMEVIRYVFLIYEGFERNWTNDIAIRWTQYITRIDDLSEFSIISCARNTTIGVRNLLSNKNGVNPNSIIAINIALEDRKIKFEPSMEILAKAIKQTYFDIIKSVKIFPRLIDQLNCREALPESTILKNFYEVLVDDETFITQIAEINNLIESNLEATSKYIGEFTKFSSIWAISIDDFMSKFQENGLELNDFESSMIKFFDYEVELMAMEDEVGVTFVNFNCVNLKARLFKYIEDWKKSFKETLHATAVKKLETLTTSLTSRVRSFKILPSTLEELDELYVLHKKSISEFKDRQEDIKVIEKYFKVLKKYGIRVQPATRKSFEMMPTNFDLYQEQINQIAIRLDDQKDNLMLKLKNLEI